MTEVKVVVEGTVDFAVAQRLLARVDATATLAADFRGKQPILEKLNGYVIASRHQPWFVLIDLDDDDCATALISPWLPLDSGQIAVRVAVREIEAWLLADSEFARVLRVPTNTLPVAPDDVSTPKRVVVELVRSHCQTKRIRSAVLPTRGSGSIGTGYKALLIDFIREHWDPDRAAERSESLRRCLTALERLTS